MNLSIGCLENEATQLIGEKEENCKVCKPGYHLSNNLC